jgi:hypothetical protein
VAQLPDTSVDLEIHSNLAPIVLPLAILLMSLATVLFGVMRRH